MARYKPYNYDQTELIPVSFNEQILPGTFEHALVYLIDEELDLSLFDARYKKTIQANAPMTLPYF